MTLLQAGPDAYRFELELLDTNGARLAGWPLERPDFDRAVEAVFFDALRQGAFDAYAPPLDRARIEPVFGRDGSPGVAGFRVVLPTPRGEREQAFEPSFFQGLARRTGARLITEGKLAGESSILCRLSAYRDEPVAPVPAGGLILELEPEPLVPILPGSRQELGPVEAWDRLAADEFPVLIPRHVIDESVEEARRQPDREVGGVLLGHLKRDTQSGELYLEVTCLVPGEETQATNVSVTFTHSTWARVREVARWRGEGELIVGWVHSHPFRLCAECPRPAPAECQAKVLFYSSDDEFLMESTFPRPFMVGLLAAVEPRLEEALCHPPVKLFGWRHGRIAARGFEVMAG